MGDRLTVLAKPEALRAATVLLLLSPFIPLMFMGEEYASTTPFLFFTSHNDELAELIRIGRRGEFKAFAAFQDEAKRAQIPDPNASSTYERSRPEATDPAHAEWLASLLQLRHVTSCPAFQVAEALGRPCSARARCAPLGRSAPVKIIMRIRR